MSERRLLIDIEVLESLRKLRSTEQRDLLQRFRAIGAAPDRFADYLESGAAGRELQVHIFGRFAIKYWDDFADRHVKILDLHPADRRSG